MTAFFLLPVMLFMGASFFHVDAEKRPVNLGQPRGSLVGDIRETVKSRNGVLVDRQWPNGIIPYTIDSSFSVNHTNNIMKGMKQIETSTCIRFVPRKNEENYIAIISGDSCYMTNLGMTGGPQKLSLREDSCYTNRHIVHELLHGVGLGHEQCRYDRDDYVTILWENTNNNSSYSRYQLRKIPQEESSFQGIPYNYRSIMHYDAWALSVNGEKVMIPTKEKNIFHLMGFGQYAQESDWEKVRRMYQCKGKYPTVNIPRSPCKDEITYCRDIIHRCGMDQAMVEGCPATCGFCEGQVPTTPPPTQPSTKPGCQDRIPNCSNWLAQCNSADGGWKEYMHDVCPKTCGLCPK